MVFIPQAQPHAKSLFLFPIVFGIILVDGFPEITTVLISAFFLSFVLFSFLFSRRTISLDEQAARISIEAKTLDYPIPASSLIVVTYLNFRLSNSVSVAGWYPVPCAIICNAHVDV